MTDDDLYEAEYEKPGFLVSHREKCNESLKRKSWEGEGEGEGEEKMMMCTDEVDSSPAAVFHIIC